MIGNMRVTPEEKGISSRSLLKLLKKIDKKGIPMHSLLVARGDDIILNAHWAPYNESTLQRMNSVTKSFITLAVGILIDDGKLSLDDKIIGYFPETKEYDVSEEIKAETVRDLISMKTTYVLQPGRHWVKYKRYNRIKDYFTNKVFKPSGTLFYYDSTGSYILGVIVERIVGKPFIDFLKERLLLKIGCSDEMTCILDAMGYSWSDSGLLCTVEDLYRVGKFINDGGVYNGERIMSEAFLREAISPLTSNCDSGNDRALSSRGYGYLIWSEINGGFGFHGMGMQYMICIPNKDLYLAFTADTQGNDEARSLFLNMCEDFMDEEVHDLPLDEDEFAHKELLDYISELKLISLLGINKSAISDKISGRTIKLSKNDMNIEWLSVSISEDYGELLYKNSQGEKRLAFGMCKNVFSEFPEDGYDNLRIGESPEGYHHPCAASAAWQDEQTLAIRVQIIGTHLGSLYIRIAWRGNEVGVQMSKTTNCFLNEYEGYAIGKMIDPIP